MRHFTRLTFTLLAASVAACGSSSTDTPTTQTSTAQSSLAAASRAELFLEGALLDDALDPTAMRPNGSAGSQRWVVARPIYRLVQAWVGTFPAACTSESGWKDLDEDGIPENSKYTFSCWAQGGPNGRYDLSGDIVIKDRDEANPSAGFDIQFCGFHVRSWLPDDARSWERTVSGSIGLGIDKLGGAHAYQLGRDLVMNIVENDGSAGLTRAAFASTSTLLYRSEFAEGGPRNDPFALGTITAAGGATLTVITVNGPIVYGWTRMTTPTLHWNRSCGHPNPKMTAPPFDGGGITYRDDAGHRLRIDFLGCGNWNVTYDDSPLR